ncbi:carbonic anhydrase 13-like [Clytia hemisphaerica]|uniref:Carbonic anhydrase n=1 Tax=Clytia hemisphaerica TaxID=252671 RepID=A0A7M5V349_9CNID
MFFSYDDGTPNGPSSWQRLNGRWTCEGRKQSPININTNTVIQDQIAKNIIIKQFPPHVPLSGIIKNNGHAPTFSLTEGVAVRLSGGTLLNDFYMKQIHFHFGCTEKTGSEHFIDGVQFPLEMHLVFWDNSTYSTFSQAAKGDNGIAVVAILFQREDITGSQPEDLTPLHQITGLLKNIRAEGEGLVISEDFGVQFDQLVPSIKDTQKADRVFIYSGSLSTPGCYESVTWMVYANTPHVTNKQLQEFRQLRSTKVNREGTMCDNYRPLQKTFGRKIYSNII